MPQQNSSKIITSLAILRANWDIARKDYIENFVPFVVNLAAKKNYKQIETTTLRADFEKEYGLILPLAPLEIILKRATKQGYFTKQDHQYIPIAEKVSGGNFISVSEAQERKLNQVVGEFKKFVKQKYDTDIANEKAEVALLNFLKDEDLEIVFNAGTIENLFTRPAVSTPLEEQSRYFVATFLQEVWKNNQIIFGFINDLVTGQMLAHTILNPDIQNYEGKLKGQKFYLDIVFLFNLLGIDGVESGSVFQELVGALKECGATLLVFRHTFDEFIKILESDLQTIHRGNIDIARANRSLKSLILNEYSPSDVELLIATAEDKLSQLGIMIADTPDWKSTRQYEIDEPALHSVITKKYKEGNPSLKEGEKDYTIQKDVDSISAIERLRKNSRPKSMPAAQHTMITGNSNLASACNEFANRDGNFTIPPCLHHLFIGTLLFLEMPTRITKLNEKKLMADAYAAIQPSDGLLKKYWTIIDELKKKGNINPNDYVVLRSSTVARNMLQEKTRGMIERLTPKTPKEILFEIESQAKSKAEKGRQEEEAAHNTTRDERDLANNKSNILEKRANTVIESIAAVCSNAAYFLAIILLAIIFYYSGNWFFKIILILLALVTYATGFHFGQLRNKLRTHIIESLRRHFYSAESNI